LHTVHNNTTLLSTKNYQTWLMSVEDIASQSSVIFEMRYTAWLKRHNFLCSCSCFPR